MALYEPFEALRAVTLPVHHSCFHLIVLGSSSFAPCFGWRPQRGLRLSLLDQSTASLYVRAKEEDDYGIIEVRKMSYCFSLCCFVVGENSSHVQF